MPSSNKNTVKKIRKASTDLDTILVAEDFQMPLKPEPKQVVELSQEESLLPFKTERVFSPNSQASD